MILKRINNRSKLLFAVMAAVCACVIFVITTFGRKDAEDDSEAFEYTALGDSIPNGYTTSEDDNLKSYPQLLEEDIEKEEGIYVNLSKHTKNGLTVDGLYEKYLSDTNVQEDLKKADLITVTIGANDILEKLYELYQEVLGADMKGRDMETISKVIQNRLADNPELSGKAAEMIYGWDCDDFEKDWKNVMESICQNRKEDAQVIVTTIYNPTGETEALGMLNQAIAGILDRMNHIITSYSATYRYQVADLSEAGINEYLQSDRLHPNQQGQQMIMEKIKEKMHRK